MERRLEVASRENVKDVPGDQLKGRVKDELGLELKSCRFLEVYTFGNALPPEQMEALGADVFTDSIAQQFSFREPMFRNTWRIEIGMLPGVTDNIGKSAREAVKDKLGENQDVYYSRVYAIDDDSLSKEDCDRIAALLHNPLVEKYLLHRPGDVPPPYAPKVVLRHEPQVEKISLHMSEARWEELVKKRLLALNLEEFKAIKRYFKKDKVIEDRRKVGLDTRVTDVELEAIAQTWSEHCKHKIFNAQISYREGEERHAINSIYQTFIKGATEQIKKPYVVSVFKDNGGIIKFNPDYDIAVKVETHNAPSALDPYGGALTGVLGVQRDIMGTGLGANPIANLDVLCFGPQDAEDVPNGVLHPRVIYDGVTRGVEHGGNKMGIPTVNGSIVFEKGYTCRPLVYCGTIGIMPSEIGGRRTCEKRIASGALIVVVGGRIGKDGIHGATFSSQQLDEHTPQSVVQIGDPITQKKVLDFLMEARDKLLYDAVTDNGAGGISSSIGELAQFSGGCEVYLDKCPLKYPGLDPWEILVSESQERMTLAVPPENLSEVENLARKHDVELSVVGKFTGIKRFHIKYKDETVAYLEMKFLHEGYPQMRLTASWKKLHFPEPALGEARPGKVLKKLLASGNITVKDDVITRYDHEVKGQSIIKPIMRSPCDAGVIRPIYDSPEGLAISHGLCPRVVQDGYAMACLSFDEAVRNAIAVGARFGYMACLDNFSWPDPIKSDKTPDGEHKLGQLVRACLGLYDCATSYGIPIISGKDSMKNDYYSKEGKHSIPPTLLVTMVGKVDDVGKCVSSDFKKIGDVIYVLGITRDELGGSEYFKLFGGVGNSPPQLRPDEHIATYKAISEAIQEGIVSSVHDASDGGIAVAFTECAIGSSLGADLDLSLMPNETEKEDALLFSESPGRFVVSVPFERAEKFEYIMKGTPFAKVGRIRGDHRIIFRYGDRIVVNEDVTELKEAYFKGVR
ncbi:MAG: phosphoribosylformylglycinamidine synthase subunit PurL [Candidatus Micrarchaeota archaeon]